MSLRDPQREQRLISAALDLADATASHAFTIQVPNTTPPLKVSLHEGPVQLGVDDTPRQYQLSDAERLLKYDGVREALAAFTHASSEENATWIVMSVLYALEEDRARLAARAANDG